MDKFLQILEDGRMTDGQGQTVYFSETLIFFTSNVGISKEIVDSNTGEILKRVNIVKPGESYEDIHRKVKEAMMVKFKPEVINRIGDNIVVFNYIDEKASKAIANSKIKKINENIQKKKEIDVSVTDEAKNRIHALCLEDEPRSNGGRGIGNVIEEHYLNPLAEFMFDSNIKAGQEIVVGCENEKIIFKTR